MALFFYRLSRRLYQWKVPVVPKLVNYLGYVFFGSQIPYTCEIGEGTKIAYGGSGIVIHKNAKIGDNCLISPGVVIGGRGGHPSVPVIGNNVSLYPGCKVLGPITISDFCSVGVNAVVIKSMNEGEVALGPVARILSPKEKG